MSTLPLFIKKINVATFIKSHKFILILLPLAIFLLFTNLGRHYVYIDEANTAFLAKNILEYGYPRIADDKNILPPFHDGSFTKHLAWVEQPWLQYYLAAASIAVFGQNSFAPRFPFALLGLLSIILLYKLVLYLYPGNKLLANLTILVYLLSIPFLLMARNCRYYSLVLIFVPLLMLMFLRWMDSFLLKDNLLYIITSILLFHSFYPFWFSFTFVSFLYFFIFNFRKNKVWVFISSHIIIALFTLPWMVYVHSTPPIGAKPDITNVTNLFAIYFWKLHTYFFPFIVLLAIYFILYVLSKLKIFERQHDNIKMFFRKETFLFMSFVIYMLMISLMNLSASQYLVPFLPIVSLLIGIILLKIKNFSHWIFMAIIIIFLLTNIIHISPYIFIEKLNQNPNKLNKYIKTPQSIIFLGNSPTLEFYLYEQAEIRFYLFDFLYELTHEYQTRLDGIIDYLIKHSKKDQTIFTWFGEAGALMYHTEMKVLYPPFPFVQTKKVKDLITHNTDTIDWVIPNGMFLPKEMAAIKPDLIYGSIDTTDYYPYNPSDYDKIPLQYPNVYYDVSPNIEAHHFRTLKNAPYFHILKRRESGIEDKNK
ncbi:MAG: ArnT family glycosyltransferase [bacterium]